MQTKHIIIIILLITSGIFYYHITDAKSTVETHYVTRVIDGDTIEIETGQSVRLKGINTPEKSMPQHQEAKELLEKLILNKTIQIENYGNDKYGRMLGQIFLDSQNINVKILQEGLATLYYYEHDKHYEKLKQAEEFARLNERGLWKKSPNEYCIEIIELEVEEPELLILENKCNKHFNITIKDDATHIYKEIIEPKSQFKKEFSHIWNTDGDSIYIYDSEGLLSFYRY